MDIVTNEYANENTRVYSDEQHKWYYWHGLHSNEVIAFVQADSDAEDRSGKTVFMLCIKIFVL